MTSITGTIAALNGDHAIRVLVDTADYQNRLPDPAELRALETGLREATTDDSELAEYAWPGTTADAGDLARATLLHLAATRPNLVSVITRAIDDLATPSVTWSPSPSAPWSCWPCRPR